MKTMTRESEERRRLREEMERQGITLSSEFVPFSKVPLGRITQMYGVRNRLSLNWKVTVLKEGKPIWTGDYSAGEGHCPYFGAQDTPYAKAKTLAWECENGVAAIFSTSLNRPIPKVGKHPILPDPQSIIASLCMDCSALDEGSFEDWCASFGYNADSISTKRIYDQCLETALKLRVGLSDTGLEALRQAAKDF